MNEMKSKAIDEKFCTECGEVIKVNAEICPHCGVRQMLLQKSSNNSKAMEILFPVNRSAWAIAAGYLGFFSILGYPAPFAILTGFMALKDIRENPTKIGEKRAMFGITMGCFGMIILLFRLMP